MFHYPAPSECYAVRAVYCIILHLQNLSNGICSAGLCTSFRCVFYINKFNYNYSLVRVYNNKFNYNYSLVRVFINKCNYNYSLLRVYINKCNYNYSLVRFCVITVKMENMENTKIIALPLFGVKVEM